jgi:hypothetical protein
VGVAEREVELARDPVVEPVNDLRVALADRIRLAGDLREVDSVDPVADQHAPATEGRIDRRDHDERMAAPEAREAAMA